MLHLFYHFLIPAIIVALFFRLNWKRNYVLMMLTMLVDLDHLIATPIYDPMRCSIGFHPLHGIIPIALYGVLCFFPKTRVIGIGLLIHMGLDSLDCRLNTGMWISYLT